VPLVGYIGNAPQFTNGQRPIDAAVPLSFQGVVVKQSWTGLLVTGGADDQDLAVSWELVVAGPATPIVIVETGLVLVDVGPG
jgi:hypothetical protein